LTDTTNLANLIDYLCLSYLVFSIGLFGLIFNYKNFLVSMLSIEVMYLGIITGFAVISIVTCNHSSQVYALSALILAASESAVGLGILIVLFKFGRNVDFTTYEELKG
jgi:NADH-quinone oxidoreductase subunit K